MNKDNQTNKLKYDEDFAPINDTPNKSRVSYSASLLKHLKNQQINIGNLWKITSNHYRSVVQYEKDYKNG